MIEAYFLFQFLPEKIRKLYNIKSKSRLDCTAIKDNIGFIDKLTKFVNFKEQLFFYLNDPADYISRDARRLAEIALTNGSHFTSLFIPELSAPDRAYGDYETDGLLFQIDWGKLQIEMLVIPSSYRLISSYFQKFLDGGYDEQIIRFRASAQPYFDYGL